MRNLKNYFIHHTQAGISSLGQFSRTPFASFMMCLVIGITLALPTALFVAIKNVEKAGTHLQQSSSFTLYLKKDISETRVNNLVRRLQNQTGIAKAYAISPKQGLTELEQQAGFQGIANEFQDSPLPWAIVITPRISYDESAWLTTLSYTLKQFPEIDTTTEVDTLWIKRLIAMIALAKRTIWSLGLLLSIAVLLIINNSIRSATQNNQKEIEIIKLMGGTNAFISRPFLYAGMLYGLLGGIIAWQLVDLLLVIIRSPMHYLAKLYGNSYELISLNFSETMGLLTLSVLLGLMGSWLAVNRYLRAARIN